MMLKKRNVDEKAIDELANDLVDKPYGDDIKNESTVRTSISLPASLHEALEDLAIKNKRSGKNLKTVSAIARQAIHDYLSVNS